MNYQFLGASAKISRSRPSIGGISAPIFSVVDQSTSTERADQGPYRSQVGSGTLNRETYFALVADPSFSSSTVLIPVRVFSAEARTSRNPPGELVPFGAVAWPKLAARQQVIRNAAAISFLDSLLEEAAGGIDEEERRNLAEIKDAIDASRLSSRKLFS